MKMSHFERNHSYLIGSYKKNQNGGTPFCKWQEKGYSVISVSKKTLLKSGYECWMPQKGQRRSFSHQSIYIISGYLEYH